MRGDRTHGFESPEYVFLARKTTYPQGDSAESGAAREFMEWRRHETCGRNPR